MFNADVLFVTILVPAIFSFHEFKFDSYLKHAFKHDWYFLMNLKFGKSAISSEEIKFEIEIAARKTVLYIEVNCPSAINDALQQLHAFLHLLGPNQQLGESLSHSIKVNFEEPISEIEISEAYRNLLNFNIQKDLESYLFSFPFEEKIFISFFEYIANIDNWLVIIPTRDQSILSKKDPWLFTKESKLFKIILKDNYTKNADKKKELLNLLKIKNLTKLITHHVLELILNF